MATLSKARRQAMRQGKQGGRPARANEARVKKKARGWMNGSPAAYIGVIIGIVGLLSTGSQWLFSYADLRSSVGTLQTDLKRDHELFKGELKRNFDEDRERNKETVRNIERLDTTIGNMAKLHTEIEVMKTQLKAINETLTRMERRMDGKTGTHMHK